jgi:hypothetical protein
MTAFFSGAPLFQDFAHAVSSDTALVLPMIFDKESGLYFSVQSWDIMPLNAVYD